MVTLPLNLRKNGFNYTQVLRNCKTAIYRQDVPPNLTYFEVFKIHIAKETILQGKVIPEHEAFPGNEDFGWIAWSCRTMDDAMKRYKEINDRIDQSVTK